MIIEITPKEIKETFGKGKNFQTLSRNLKIAKLSTVHKIPDVIQNGILINDDVPNYHNPSSSVKYAYIQSDAVINGQPVTIEISVRKSPQKNKFWMHKIDIKENIGSNPTGASSKMGYHTSDSDIIYISDEKVNSNAEKI